MNIYIEHILKEKFTQIETLPSNEKLQGIKEFFDTLLDMYLKEDIDSQELGYYITSTVQYKEYLSDNERYLQLYKLAGLLELPSTQVEDKGHDREAILKQVIDILQN